LKVTGAPTVLARKLGSLLFHTGKGLLLHNVLTFVFSILLEDPTVSFMTSSSRVCPGVSFSVLLLTKCSCLFYASVLYAIAENLMRFPTDAVLMLCRKGTMGH
jgi:hypothetical protein